MFDELILHIGMPKTGTTSIQRSLNATGGGADWTYLDPNPPHSANPVILRAYGGIAPESTHPGPITAQTQTDARALMERLLAGARTPRAILSAEAMIRLQPPIVAEMFDHFSHHARSVSGIAYIRPPVSFITSYVQQFYKTAHAPLAEVVQRSLRPNVADFAMWDHMLGKENLTLRPFVRDRFPNGSVVLDFAQNLSLGPVAVTAGQANQSLSGDAVRLLVQFRKHFPARQHGDGRILSQLAQLDGPEFALHPDVLEGAKGHINALRDWSEERMDWTMPVGFDATENVRAIRNDADFDDILPQTLNWLAARTGRRASALKGNGYAIAQAVADLRDQSQSPISLGNLLGRIRRA